MYFRMEYKNIWKIDAWTIFKLEMNAMTDVRLISFSNIANDRFSSWRWTPWPMYGSFPTRTSPLIDFRIGDNAMSDKLLITYLKIDQLTLLLEMNAMSHKLLISY